MLDSTLLWMDQLMDATQAGRASAAVLLTPLQEIKHHLVDNFKARVLGVDMVVQTCCFEDFDLLLGR